MRPPPREHLIGAIALAVAGWVIGLAIYLPGSSDDQLPFELTDDSKLYVRRIEELGGKSGVIYQQLGDFLGSLWQAPRLGLTIGVLASVVAVCWFLIARRGD